MARKILLADDSVTAQNMGRKILADAGYEVITVNNGSAALKKIAEVKPDLVILDIYMPGYSGLEVCQRLKEMPDSSRIPVMLTVGKLEPFKPEEAQRVRAEGFIVKPFEASELLSALSKLEDKIVPRSEASKSGRFARAIAAVEDSGRGRSSEFGEPDENGWRSRIVFPAKKNEDDEEKVADDAAIYNPVNRDLRTVVALPEEVSPAASALKKSEPTKAAEKKLDEKPVEENKVGELKEEPEESRKYNRRKTDPQSEHAEESSVDVAALASPGLPQDVTPEEVAAIAAAAAQIKSLQAVLENDKESTPATQAADAKPSEVVVAEVKAAESRPAEPPVPESPVGVADSAPGIAPISEPAASLHSGKSQDASSETQSANELVSRTEDSTDALVTMAVAATPPSANEESSASRWTAVSVALDAEEASLSLEHEMQKSYAAFVAEESAAAQIPQTDPVPPQSSVASVENAVEASVAISNPVPEPAVAQSAEDQSFAPQPQTAATVPVEETSSTTAPEPVMAEQDSESVSAQLANAISEHVAEAVSQAVPQVPEPVAIKEYSAEQVQSPAVTPTASTDPEKSTSSRPFTSFVPVAASSSPSQVSEESHSNHHPERDEESEALKTTAAAWANWRQIREAGEAKPAAVEAGRNGAEAHISQEEDAAAMAVAAGAEQAPQDASQPPAELPGDVAGIVDSLLADLRPKLMAEISRKMSEKK